ncbi:hypothetical protein ZIOFF_018037 [Zingiber officinale]|uniref:NEDD8-activating enzyme E1 catalytic subunit n=1 Tax=Zingiber officinale TaxID=94328 RepID=A0A8J5H6E0_ZINOF|nr:hypothetical protein ZIOFF_018037 [Zingiber officinale]
MCNVFWKAADEDYEEIARWRIPVGGGTSTNSSAAPATSSARTSKPSPILREDIGDIVRVLVVGAGGLGCELLKDLALSGFKNIDVIDMDTIEVSNLNRQFLFRIQDVGKSKAEVAAERVMKRINGVNITSHFCRIKDEDLTFFNDFNIIVLGLDSIEARSYINSIACGFLEYDEDDKPLLATIKPIVDGGTEETPRTAAHCIEYSHLIKWGEVHHGKSLMLMILSICSGFTQRYNGLDGTHIKVTDFVRDTDCLFLPTDKEAKIDLKGETLFWRPKRISTPRRPSHSGALATRIPLVVLPFSKPFIELVGKHRKLLVSKASVTYRGKNLYMQSLPILEEMTRANLQLRMFDLIDKVPRDTSFLRKLRVVFKRVTDEASSRAHKLSRL